MIDNFGAQKSIINKQTNDDHLFIATLESSILSSKQTNDNHLFIATLESSILSSKAELCCSPKEFFERLNTLSIAAEDG